MQASRRYVCAAAGAILVFVLVIYTFSQDGDSDSLLQASSSRRRSSSHLQVQASPEQQDAFMAADDVRSEQDLTLSARHRRQQVGRRPQPCTMDTCFDHSRCRRGFFVYVYPVKEPVSEKYQEILASIKKSTFYTTDPHKACVFVLSLDTLDRDSISAGYTKNLQESINKLEHWRGGLNHIIFNLYSGTWPDYKEDELGFDIGKAILAEASASESFFRRNFDISFPLFHKEHAARGGEKGKLTANTVPPVRKYTLVFKGKRYLTGIGSETRNSLYHLHNDQDIILLTTCKHGRGWKKLADERCEKDNALYETYDYKILLHNSTFCLVPRGRRLGSYRFLEVLQAGCIPVLLSNGIVMPFDEVIDWNRAVVWGDERLLLQVPSIVRAIPHSDILALRQQTQFLWETYFSSIDKTVQTTFEIVRNRVQLAHAHTAYMWNNGPGALSVLPNYSHNLRDFPFYFVPLGTTPNLHFTAVIYATTPASRASDPIYRLLKHLLKSSLLAKVIILWHHDSLPPPNFAKIPVQHKVPIVVKSIKMIGERFGEAAYSEIETDAVFNLDEDALLQTDEFEFAMSVWQYFPERIVGYAARGHYWHDSRARWAYSSKHTNHYSMVLTGAAVLHKYYLYMYTNYLNSEVLSYVNQLHNCEDILMNFLVSDVAKYPPVKLTQRRAYKDGMLNAASPVNRAGAGRWLHVDHFLQRQKCVNHFTEYYGFMPLLHSNLRMDPVLFKDPVAITRKKYRQIEVIV